MPRPLPALALLLLLAPAAAAQRFGPSPAPTGPGGTRATVDLPKEQHIRNVGGSDGAGLCVFSSITVSAHWQNVTVLDGYRRWMEARRGGGWPEKVDQTLAAYCREKGVPVPGYVQHTGGEASFLELALRTDRCPAVTYCGQDDFYRGTIAHMVNLAHLDETRAAIIDNNRPGTWLWMSRADFLARWRGNQGGWAVVLLDPPPPPYTTMPVNGPEHNWVGSGPRPGWLPPAPVAVGQVYHPADPPAPAPAAETVETKDGGRVPLGVDPAKIHDAPEYSISGRAVTRAEAFAAVSAGNLADDTDHWHLTAVGDAQLCARLRADVAALPGEVRGKLLVQCYPAGSWAAAQFGLPAGVSLRAPSPGRVAAQVGAVGAAEYLAGTTTLGDLLSLAGGPTPRPVPVPTPMPSPGPSPAPTPDPAPRQPINVPPWLLALGLAALVILTRRRA